MVLLHCIISQNVFVLYGFLFLGKSRVELEFMVMECIEPEVLHTTTDKDHKNEELSNLSMATCWVNG